MEENSTYNRKLLDVFEDVASELLNKQKHFGGDYSENETPLQEMCSVILNRLATTPQNTTLTLRNLVSKTTTSSFWERLSEGLHSPSPLHPLTDTLPPSYTPALTTEGCLLKLVDLKKITSATVNQILLRYKILHPGSQESNPNNNDDNNNNNEANNPLSHNERLALFAYTFEGSVDSERHQQQQQSPPPTTTTSLCSQMNEAIRGNTELAPYAELVYYLLLAIKHLPPSPPTPALPLLYRCLPAALSYNLDSYRAGCGIRWKGFSCATSDPALITDSQEDLGAIFVVQQSSGKAVQGSIHDEWILAPNTRFFVHSYMCSLTATDFGYNGHHVMIHHLLRTINTNVPIIHLVELDDSEALSLNLVEQATERSRQSDLTGAMKLFAECERKTPNTCLGKYSRGMIMLLTAKQPDNGESESKNQSLQLKGAINSFVSGLQRDDTHPLLLVQYANTCFEMDQLSTAAWNFQKALTVSPQNLEALSGLANVKFVLGDVDGARALAVKYADECTALANKYWKHGGNHTLAVEFAIKALFANPNNVDAETTLVELFKESNDERHGELSQFGAVQFCETHCAPEAVFRSLWSSSF